MVNDNISNPVSYRMSHMKGSGMTVRYKSDPTFSPDYYCISLVQF